MSGVALDMTLDELIKINKKSEARGRGRAVGTSPTRRQLNQFANRAGPYAAPKARESALGHDMFSGGSRVRLLVSILGQCCISPIWIMDFLRRILRNCLQRLVTCIKRHVIHYDRSGRSKGTAEVVFSRRRDTLAAIKRYNNIYLDGKPMKIELVGTNISASAGAGPPSAGAFGGSNVVSQSGQGRGGFGRPRAGIGGGGVRGCGFGRAPAMVDEELEGRVMVVR